MHTGFGHVGNTLAQMDNLLALLPNHPRASHTLLCERATFGSQAVVWPSLWYVNQDLEEVLGSDSHSFNDPDVTANYAMQEKAACKKERGSSLST